MRDSEVVAAIVAGDPGGLAEAYDKYAAPLYAYCRSLLREPADAADVVQDTFVIAASRLAGLRDQNRLRPWLYAVARNECYRRMRATATTITAPPDTMPDVTDATADVSGEADRAELRALLRSAVRGLNASDQDLIELQIRQGLGVAEIAAMLGVSRNHAHALLSRARDQLETSLGALLVARTGREDCVPLSAMLEGWDGQLTVLMRKRLHRHIERCPVCAERKRRELAPALLLGLAPLAALSSAAMPAGLRAHVLKLASSDTPEAVAHRAIVAQHTALFGHTGFPKPLDPPKPPPWWRTRQGQVTAGGVTAAAVAAAVIGVALASGGPRNHAGQAALARGAAPSSTGTVSGSGPPTQSPRPQPTASAGAVVPSSPGPVVSVAPSGPASGTVGAVASSGSPSSSRSAKGSAPASPGLTPSPEPSSSSSGVTMGPKSPAATTSTPAATPPPSSSSPPPPVSPGTLGVSPTSILLSVGSSATLTLTASNGPVSWSVTESQGLIGGLTVSPSSGTLASGSSTTVTVSASNLLTVGGQLTVQPSGITVTVVLSLNLGVPAPGPGHQVP